MSDWQKLLCRLRPLTPKTGRRRRSSLSLEMLEDRCVPATFFVNNTVGIGSDNNSGTSTSSPFASIQAAVNAAKTQGGNNTILVATGSTPYINSGQPNPAITVGFPSVVGITDQQLTIIGGYDPTFSTVIGQSTIDGSSQIRGVAVVSTSRATGVSLSNFVIQNCLGGQSTISSNLDGFGGGMIIVVGSTTNNPTDTLSNVTFTNDEALGTTNTSTGVNGGSGGEGAGGGLAAFANDNVVLNGVTFNGNSARGGNGVVRGGSGLGGAIFVGNAGQITGNNVTFTNNAAVAGNTGGVGQDPSTNAFEEGFGGAVALFNPGTTGAFTNVTATGNLAQGGSAGNFAGDGRGGAFYSENASWSLTSSTLMNNTAQGGMGQNGADATVGGAIYATAFTSGATVMLNQDSLINNTVIGPTVTGAATQVLGGGLGADSGSGQVLTLNVTNTVIAGNSVTSATTPVVNSGGGGLWSNAITVYLQQDTIADNVIGATNMTGSSILIFTGTDNLADNIIADESVSQPAIGSDNQGGTVNLNGINLFVGFQNIGVTLPSNQINLPTEPESAVFANAPGRNYMLVSGSPAIGAATDSTVPVDIRGFHRVSPNDLGAYQLNGISPTQFVDELAAYRPSDGSWSLDSDGTMGFTPGSDQTFLHFSPPGVTGVAGDWTASGTSEIGDFSSGVWHLDLNDNGSVDAGEMFTYGAAGDQPVVGDWNGDGKDDIGVFRAAADGITGEFILDTNEDHIMDAGDETFTFGLATDRIVVGDWTGDGRSKVGVFRDAKSFNASDAGDAVFSLDTNNDHQFDAGDSVFVFGLITDGLIIGDWNGNGISKVGVYRDGSSFGAPGTALFSLDTNGNLQFDSGIDAVFLYGNDTDQFVSGHWKKTPPLQPAEFAANGVGPGAAALTPDQLAPVVQQAIAYWAAKGANEAQLEAVPVQIGQLNGNLVGWTDANGITISNDAAGWGWYTGAWPVVPANQMDLLTVVEHEFGHEVGLSDVDPATHPGDLMDSTLPTGVRRP